jgi:hypothetical protein
MTDTKLVNVKVKYIRPKYNNLKEWINNPNNIYIGRKGCVFVDGQRFPPKDSIWCNPFTVKQYTREQAIEKYRLYITEKIKNEHLENELEKLKGKTLGCWCYPEKCHGNILLELLEK